MLVDTHCHLDFPEYDQDRDEVISRAKEQGISYIIDVGSSLKGSERAVELSRKYASIYAAVGVHPHEADGFTPQIAGAIRDLAAKDKVVAIGEIGLDYFKQYSQIENQIPLFLNLLALSKESGLPLVIHTRDAQVDTLRILKEAMPVKAVIHCFSGDKAFLSECLDLGFLVSFACNVTYKKAEGLRDVIKAAPLNRLLLETDAPYLSPEGSRGKRNEPANVRQLAQVIAGIKEIGVDEVERVTTDTARQFFNIK
ncbi:MAG: TatD family hydrolase [Candidatus Omnitrophota bacterium]